MSTRREFMTLLGGAAVAWPVAARAQQGERIRRVGVFVNLAEHDREGQRSIEALENGLREFGWIEGRNIHVDYRWSPGADTGRIRAAAADLAALKPDVILASATEGLAAFNDATRTIPIIFVSVSDPVGQGFVSNLARPGGNITGFTAFEFSMGGKWIEILKEIAPKLARVAVLFNPKTAPYFASFLQSIEIGAVSVGMPWIALPVNEVAEIEPAITAFAREPDGGLICPSDSFTSVHRKTIISLAASYQLPAIYTWREFAPDGGLVTYGIERTDLYRRAAPYVDRILRGAHPGDLPVQQPTKFELLINLKAAKVLGLEIPPTLLARADEVIE
jgi:putative tryptophan/tyrosine transport system substrate-binding protein